MYSFWALYVVKDEKAHYLELDDATEISYEWLSPMWNTETSTTWDFSLPRTPYNEELLLPSSANGELIPLNEGRLHGYLTGLPWQDTDEAYWGLLTVLSASERRIKVQFLQKSLFEQKLEVPVREIKVDYKPKKHRIAFHESAWAGGKEWRQGSVRDSGIIAWDAANLLAAYAEEFGYDLYNSYLGTNKFYLISNLPNSFPTRLRWVNNEECNYEKARFIRKKDGRLYEYSSYIPILDGDCDQTRQYLNSQRIAIKLIRDVLSLFCATFRTTEYIPGHTSKPRLTYRGAGITGSARVHLGELSSYEWVSAPYPHVQDVALRTEQDYSTQARSQLIPIVAYEQDHNESHRQYPVGNVKFCFYNDIIDGRPYDYVGECTGRTFYPPYPKDKQLVYGYIPLEDYYNPTFLKATSALCDCAPEGVAVSSSRYSVDTKEGVWRYIGENLTTRRPCIKGRGVHTVDIPFQRGRFIAITAPKESISTFGDTLLNSELKKYEGPTADTGEFADLKESANLKVQPFEEPISLYVNNTTNIKADSKHLPSVVGNKGNAKNFYDFFEYMLKSNHPLPPSGGSGGGGGGHYDWEDIPLPPGYDDDRKPWKRENLKLRSVSALPGVTTLNDEEGEQEFRDRQGFLKLGSKLFYAYTTFYLNTIPLMPCLELDPYDPSKPRAERLYIVGRKADYSKTPIELHPNAAKVKFPYELIEGSYKEACFTNDLPLEELVLPYFRHLWHAVEGELSSWEEEEVFKYMTEFNYPNTTDAAHIGNQRIKRVTMVLRRNECRIKSVRVIQFNRMATEDEFNKFLQ